MSQFKLPDLGEGLAEAIIREWHVAEGDHIALDAPMVTVETAKATVDVPSPQAGTIEKIHALPGSTVQTGAVIITYTSDIPASATVVGTLEEASTIMDDNPLGISVAAINTPTIKAMPAARVFAKKHHIDLTDVTPSNGHSITLEDIQRHQTAQQESASRQHITNTMCQIMEQSKQHVVPATLQDALVLPWYGQQDMTVRIIQSILHAATMVPKVNAHFESISKQLIPLQKIELGIAVQTEHGLFLPTLSLPDSNTSADQIRTALNTIKTKASQVTFTREDLRTPSMIFSNIGTVAGRYATPVVVPPSVAIIATGKAYTECQCLDGVLTPQWVLPVSISFDHRGLTGAEIAHFMRAMAEDLARC
jgi:2-oxoisovalerate dehydrogenase E2 component (dihydrolipoyl transacylase)